MITFNNDEQGYLDYVRKNPRGYVLNVRKEPDPEYVVLHRASCGSINSEKRPYGGYTMRSYRKICSTDMATLRQAAVREGRRDGSFSNHCKLCKPPNLT